MKKFLLVLMGLLLSLPSFAQDTFTYEYEGQTLTYKILDASENTCEVTKGDKISGALILPANPKNGPIAYTLTQIGQYAFEWCGELTSVEIPNSVKAIKSSAFAYCNALTSIEIPESVTFIDGFAFNNCGFNTVDIPKSVTNLQNDAFFACHELESVNVAASNPNYVSIDGVVFNKDKTELHIYPTGKKGRYVIPESVTRILNWAFIWCKGLTSVEIPKSISQIDREAFFHCENIESVYYAAEDPITTVEGSFYCSCANTVLYVPEVAVEKCRVTEPWMRFKEIRAFDFTGLDTIGADESESQCEIYTLKGVRAGEDVTGLPSGIYIVRQGDTAKKICVK